MPTTNLSARSSWIHSISYFHAPDGTPYLAVFTKSNSAFLYRNIPSYLPGLITAGLWKETSDAPGHTGGYWSVGRAFHRYLRTHPIYRHQCQYIGTEHETRQLRRMIEKAEGMRKEAVRVKRNATRNSKRRMERESARVERESFREALRETLIRYEQEQRVEAETAMAWM